MSESVSQLRRDLLAEQESLEHVVGDIDEEQWRRPTSSPGWSVADQISHLSYFDASAATAIVDPDRFQADLEELIDQSASHGVDGATLAPFRSLSGRALLGRWRDARHRLNEAAETLHDGQRVPWYGPSMGATSFLTARLMETWAHGVDVVDSLGVDRPASDRLRHVAQLGYITRAWSYRVRGEEPPSSDVRVELTSPRGEIWTWGQDDAQETLRGSAEDFCLVVTQRRHVDDTSLVTGATGRDWLLRAQAFAGAASLGPEPRRTA